MHDDTTVSPPRDLVALLHEVRQRVRELVEAQPEPALSSAVAVMDALTVRDVIAHLAGGAADAARGSGRRDASCATASARAHAAAHTNPSSLELLDDWDVAMIELGPLLADDAELASALLVEAVTHEHDLRTVFDAPGFRDDPSVLAVLDILSDALSERIVARGLPALRITVEQWGTIAGKGAAVRCLVADRFDFVRGMSGRRSARQVEKWNWDTGAGAYLEVLPAQGVLPELDVRERDPRVPEHMQDFDLRH